MKMKVSMLDMITLFLSELIATALLVFLGCMGCIEKANIFPNTHFQMCLNFGLVIMILVQCFGCVSGAHMNPAVTLAAIIYKHITPPIGALYAAAQIVGGFLGYGILKAIIPDDIILRKNAQGKSADHALCVTVPAPDIEAGRGVAIEFILTLVLILTCCGVWDPRNAKHHDSVAIKFGLAVGSLAITGGAFTGASMNPARSFGPALWNMDFTDHWVYWIGPLAAAAVGAFGYKTVFRREAPEEKDLKLRAMEELPLR